jgi:hypothetical protein
VDIAQGQKWPRARDNFFEEPANPTVTEPDAYGQHKNANDSSRAAFADEKDAQDDERRKEKRIAADNRHDLIEKRIASGLINEPKGIDI